MRNWSGWERQWASTSCNIRLIVKSRRLWRPGSQGRILEGIVGKKGYEFGAVSDLITGSHLECTEDRSQNISCLGSEANAKYMEGLDFSNSFMKSASVLDSHSQIGAF